MGLRGETAPLQPWLDAGVQQEVGREAAARAVAYLEDVKVSGCDASSGGGIYSTATAELLRCVVRDCSVTQEGGLLTTEGGSLAVRDSLLSGGSTAGVETCENYLVLKTDTFARCLSDVGECEYRTWASQPTNLPRVIGC